MPQQRRRVQKYQKHHCKKHQRLRNCRQRAHAAGAREKERYEEIFRRSAPAIRAGLLQRRNAYSNPATIHVCVCVCVCVCEPLLVTIAGAAESVLRARYAHHIHTVCRRRQGRSQKVFGFHNQ